MRKLGNEGTQGYETGLSGGIDRRNFLKGAALSALGVASVGALAACSPQASPDDAAVSDIAEEDAPFEAE